jgi:hypothetical protein
MNMALEPFEVTPNAQLEIGDDSGFVIAQSNGTISLASYKTGKVTQYLTDYLMEHANVYSPPVSEPAAPSETTSNFTAPSTVETETPATSAAIGNTRSQA